MKKFTVLALIALTSLSVSVYGQNTRNKKANYKTQTMVSDRQYWADLAYKISAPVLENLSKGELRKNMEVEYSPIWDGRDKNVAYLEAFGRLMAGIAPWLALPDDGTPEGARRAQLREWALKSYANAVDPESPDYMLWTGPNQVLVDASYLAVSFLRAPKALWEPLDDTTKLRYIKEFKTLKRVYAPYNNWLLFRAMIETFLAYIGVDYDAFAILTSMNKLNDWYVGDGYYQDGSDFALDYYNSFVIHPYIVEISEIMGKKGRSPIKFDLALRRMQRYNVLAERMISPEGTFPPLGRSMTYRMGSFQPLALAAWRYGLPEGLSNGQVRSALTVVMKNMFSVDGNFNEGGFLTLGFVGHQPNLADYYTNSGSVYMTSLVFMPLGLPQGHAFWADPAEQWTSQKAWSGQPFPKDYHVSIKELK